MIYHNTYVCMYIYIYICIHICIYIYREREISEPPAEVHGIRDGHYQGSSGFAGTGPARSGPKSSAGLPPGADEVVGNTMCLDVVLYCVTAV